MQTSGPASHRRAANLRRLNRIACIAFLVLLVGGGLFFHFWSKGSSKRELARQIARAEAAGLIVPVEELLPTVPEGETNAADIYEQALPAVLNLHTSLSEDEWRLLNGPWTSPARVALIERIVTDNSRHFELLEEASRHPRCAFPVQRDAWSPPRGEHLWYLGEAVSWQARRAEAAAAAGDIDAALSHLATALRVIEHMAADPNIVAQRSVYRGQTMVMVSLAEALSVGDPSPEACRRLFDQLGAIDQVSPSVRALQAEVALVGMPVFQAIRAGAMPAHEAVSHAWSSESSLRNRHDNLIALGQQNIAPYLLDQDHTLYLRSAEQAMKGLRAPWPENVEMVMEAEQMIDEEPRLRALVSVALMKTEVKRMLWSRERAHALIRAGQIALAAKAYHHQHGAYADQLNDLTADGWDLPDDPCTGTQFGYRREPKGFILWSPGSESPPTAPSGVWAKNVWAEWVNGRRYEVFFRCER